MNEEESNYIIRARVLLNLYNLKKEKGTNNLLSKMKR